MNLEIGGEKREKGVIFLKRQKQRNYKSITIQQYLFGYVGKNCQIMTYFLFYFNLIMIAFRIFIMTQLSKLC